ncbi:hypothetical protein ACHAQA_005973 [Verticillium albo-atrum]
MAFNTQRYWRVMDDDSRATFDDDDNIVAGSDKQMTFDCRTDREARRLHATVEAHLNWSHPEDSPFISVYGDKAKYWAEVEAMRRVKRGRENVVLAEIVLRPGPWRVSFRSITRLVEEFDVEIPENAEHNAEYEFVFLHGIPAEYVHDIKKCGRHG